MQFKIWRRVLGIQTFVYNGGWHGNVIGHELAKLI